MDFEKRILCIGAGYVGGPTMAMIAEKCPQYRVELVDINEERIRQWNSDELPIYEPGLDEIVFRNRGKNLFFTTEVDKGIAESDIIFVSVNTPTKTYGQGAGRAADLQYWEKTAHQILRNSKSDKIVVEKSTLPVRTAEAMARILNANQEGPHFEVLSNPEFLAEGTAIEDLHAPDRVLVGCMNTESGIRAVEQVEAIYANWIPKDRIIRTNIWSCELSKLVANAFLAQRISSINAISALCEKTEADVNEVARAIGLDTRIGSKFLKAGIGFGGSCFKKDIMNLSYICEQNNLPEVAAYWESVVRINNYQHDRFVENMLHAMFNTMAGKKIAVLGFAFKSDTGDTRESPAIRVCRQLVHEHALVRVTDPQALDNARRDLDTLEGISFHEDPYEALEGASALALMTDWKEYAELDFEKIYSGMMKPAFVFDGRNLFDHDGLYEIGFNVYPTGKVARVHF
ncbi:MAG: nucleotide sugar dehydrogenase [Candidatus Sumerlaeia bacterium]